MNNRTILLIAASVFFLYVPSAFSDETLTLTTYYPSPVGMYKELCSQRSKVGRTYSGSATTVANDTLIVEGNIGVGTPSPTYQLDVAKTTNDAIIRTATTGAGAYLMTDSTTDGYFGWEMDSAGVGKWYLGSYGYNDFSIVRGSRSGGTRLLTVLTGGNVGINNTNPGTKFSVFGLTPTGLYSLVRVDTTTGNFYYDSSSARYKDNIEDLTDNFSTILKAQPRKFKWKKSGISDIGFIAEEFDALGLKSLVAYNKDGLPESIHYEKVPLYLLGVAKNQQAQIGDLKKENDALKQQLAGFEKRLLQLESHRSSK
jgi:hypothetical protein